MRFPFLLCALPARALRSAVDFRIGRYQAEARERTAVHPGDDLPRPDVARGIDGGGTRLYLGLGGAP